MTCFIAAIKAHGFKLYDFLDAAGGATGLRGFGHDAGHIRGIFPAGGIAWKTKRAARCGNTGTAERK